ncbi:MAG: methyl-accepting chemotaxis protein [Firmicutes bacterium]|nr:methyl-accepting chemotaxis protein [Bacillota bacterium]
MAAGNLDLLSYQESGEDMTVAFAPIPITGWSIATVAKTNDLYSDLTLLRSSFVKLTLFVLSIGVLLSYVFARGLAQPLVKLTNTVQLVAEGDFSQTLAMDRKDEIGQLAVAFNRMVTAIQRLLDAIRNSGNQVERYSLELSSSMEENNASITEIANAAAELATTVEQMNERSQEMLVTTKEISNKVVAGEQALDNTVTQTAVLKEDIQGLYNAIDSLNAHSVEVEKIVEAIAHIAEQTNLLALNASIEAARAGEHGRGFAVVAEEIRQLSDQSKLATENIAQSLAGIKKDVQQAVKGIESGIIQAEDTADIVAQSSVTLHEVLDSVTNLTEGLNEILNNIATVGEGSQQMAAMTEEQSAIVEHLSTASTELSKMSQELLGLFQEFIL